MVRIKRKLYSHWGVCISRTHMVHISPPGPNNELNMIKSLAVEMPAKVTISKMVDVAAGSEYYSDNFLDGEPGFEPRPVRDICNYAMQQVKAPDQEFDLVWNNCEKFAIMCRLDSNHSLLRSNNFWFLGNSSQQRKISAIRDSVFFLSPL